MTADRAIQFKKILISESETIILFTALYKLMFLGTSFTEKVLQIQLQPSETIIKEVTAKTELIEIIDSASEVSSDGGAYLNGSPGSEDS